MAKIGTAASGNPVWQFIDANLRGAGQVMFMSNPITGALILLAIIWGAVSAKTPQVAIGAIAGLIIGTLTAIALRVEKASLRQGLYGFSPLLTGAAVPTFLDNTAIMWVYLVIGTATTTVVTLAVSNVFNTWKVPALTFPFVLTSWFLMLAAYQFHRMAIGTLGPPKLPGAVARTGLDLSVGDWIAAMLKGVSQVFLIGDWVSGLLILVGLAVNSRWAAGLGAAAAVIATLIAAGAGADATSVTAGLFGFSAVLTAIGVGCVFYHPSWPVLLYALLATVFTVVVQGALNTALAPVGVPSFTAPFVFATWLFLLPKRDLVPVRHHERIPDGVMNDAKPKA